LADELKEKCNLEAELIGGSKGIFDVVVDGKVVFSKFKTGRFPHPGEIAGMI